jgi:hypothetical protein
MPYIILRGRWCNIIVLNLHPTCEDKSDDEKDSFCEELGGVFDQFPRYDLKSWLGDIIGEVDRKSFLNRQSETISHGITNDNGTGVANFATP